MVENVCKLNAPGIVFFLGWSELQKQIPYILYSTLQQFIFANTTQERSVRDSPARRSLLPSCISVPIINLATKHKLRKLRR